MFATLFMESYGIFQLKVLEPEQDLFVKQSAPRTYEIHSIATLLNAYARVCNRLRYT